MKWLPRIILLAGVLVVQSSSVPVVQAQNIPAVGSDATLDVATWNIEMFGGGGGPSDNERQLANVIAVMRAAQVDLWAIEEVTNEAIFDRLVDSLGTPYQGFLATGSTNLKYGFIVDTDVIHPRTVGHILEGSSEYFAGRSPWQLVADVMLPDTTVDEVTFIAIHMKCCSDSYDRRRVASQRLKSRLDVLSPNDPVVVLGDFNDELTRSITSGEPSPYANFVDDAGHYSFLTLPLEESNVSTFCGSTSSCSTSSTIDHILITDELFAAYQKDSIHRYGDLLDAFDGTGGACGGEYVCTTSDHLPVYARFDFKTNTATEAVALPNSVALSPAYPNPFRQFTSIAYTLDRPAPVQVSVFDVLGRRVSTLDEGVRTAGAHTVRIDGSALAPGTYLVRVTGAGWSKSVRLVRVR